MSTKCEIEILTLDQYLTLKSEGYEFEGQSYLFWEYIRILNEVKPKYFLLENVLMSEKWERIISNTIGLNPIEINSALVSAQNRRRLYWTNIGLEPGGLFGYLESTIKQPKDKGILLKDILESEVDEKYFLSDKILKGIAKSKSVWKDRFKPHNESTIKSHTLTSRYHKMGKSDPYIIASRGRNTENSQKTEQNLEPRFDGKTNTITSVQKDNLVIHQRGRGFNKGGIFEDKSPPLTSNSWEHNNTLKIRRLTPLECERLQTVPDNYTNHVSDTQRYRMLGNGWTVDVLAHIFSYLK